MQDQRRHFPRLTAFLKEERDKRNMSSREFAAFCGVSPQVIHRYLDEDNTQVSYPSTETIFRIARATKTPPHVILDLVAPDDLRMPGAEDFRLSWMIEKLTPEMRNALDAFLLGAILEGKKQAE